MLVKEFVVDSPNVAYTEEAITSTYAYQTTDIGRSADGKWVAKPTTHTYQFKTSRRVPKLG
jgi:myo-inositol-1-phosphate synthase